ncbi:MAG: sn-glycerol-3-phosphate ABC transporter ATP-binding protein UgpC [Clostridia bacterium]|nr:sn-glycerol-3-phosphate ABC transporter ATP-binding protein UgpC [Clostridia bacterium]
MASLSLKHIYKVYDGTTKAVNDFNMEIRDKEFIVFVGPSGCGKSTTLRMIAGLEDISAGELRIDGDIVNDVEPGDRNIAMVFQNYALYPHMTVYENMAFALKTAKVPKDVIHQKVTEAARILGITEYLARKPKALSGGQRQRVALGRAIVRSPKVFLLDEPLSNLDAKLRGAMRAEITRLHERLGTTFIYVTHDQVEAMTMGSRIVVMKGGFVQQIDTPKNLYNHPANLFVAGFMGTPPMSFHPATLKKEGNTVRIKLDSGPEMTADYATLNRVQTRYMDGAHPVILGVRPDDVVPWREGMDPTAWAKLPLTVTVVEALGGETLVYGHIGVAVPDSSPIGAAAEDTEEGKAPAAATGDNLIIKAPADFEAHSGDTVFAAVNLAKLHLFDRETEASIKPRVPTENICPCTPSDGHLTFAGQRFPLPPALKEQAPREQTPSGNSATQKKPEGELSLPAEALLLGTGMGRAKVEETEIFNGDTRLRTLYRLTVGGMTLFALESAPPRYRVGDSVPFDLDFSRIAVDSHGITPLRVENTLDGRFTKEKELDDKGRKTYRFYLDMEDQPVAVTEELREKLFSCKGTAILRALLSYRFPPDAVTVTPRQKEPDKTALAGRVTRLLDYGRITYAEIDVGGKTVIAPYDGKAGESRENTAVSLVIDQTKLTVVDREADIVIV